MSEHILVVTDVATRPLEFDRWQASCSCGFIGNVVPEELADRQADEHREEVVVVARIAAAVAAEREACAALAQSIDLDPLNLIANRIRARGGQ